MNSIAMLRSRRSSSRIAITSAWVVTSSAVVGSSASSRRGSVSKVGGDHHSLQQTAGQFVRVLAQPPPTVVDADLVEQFDAWASAAARVTLRLVRSASVMKSPIDRTGLMWARGSWKIIPISHAIGPQRRSLQRGDVATVEADRAVLHRARREQPGDRPGGHRLARARLTDQPQRLTGADVERDVVQHRAQPARASADRQPSPSTASKWRLVIEPPPRRGR